MLGLASKERSKLIVPVFFSREHGLTMEEVQGKMNEGIREVSLVCFEFDQRIGFGVTYGKATYERTATGIDIPSGVVQKNHPDFPAVWSEFFGVFSVHSQQITRVFNRPIPLRLNYTKYT